MELDKIQLVGRVRLWRIAHADLLRKEIFR